MTDDGCVEILLAYCSNSRDISYQAGQVVGEGRRWIVEDPTSISRAEEKSKELRIKASRAVRLFLVLYLSAVITKSKVRFSIARAKPRWPGAWGGL